MVDGGADGEMTDGASDVSIVDGLESRERSKQHLRLIGILRQELWGENDAKVS